MAQCVNLIVMLCEVAPAILVVDALDECSSRQREILLESFDEIIDRAGDVVKVLVASRYERDIAANLQSATHIEMTPAASQEDMHTYIETGVVDFVRRWCRIHQETEDSKAQMSDRISTALKSGANGMFLWVKLQMQLIEDRNHVKCRENIESTLSRLPPSLEATYKGIIERIRALDDPPRSIATNALKWLLCSRQKLDSEQFILTIKHYSKGATTISSSALMDYCCSLVIRDKQADCFRLCHPTVRDYLLDQTDQFSLTTCNLAVAETCIGAYVWRDEDDDGDHDSAVRRYAARHWPFHFEQAQTPKLSHLVVELLVEEEHLDDWMNDVKALPPAQDSAWNIQEERRLNSCLSSPSSALFVICSFGLNEAIDDPRIREHLDFNGLNIDGASGLYLAARWGQVKVVSTLIEKNVDVNIAGGHYKTPLLAAAVNGYPQITKLLVEHGAGLTPGDGFSSPFHAAIAHDYEVVVETLIGSGVHLKDQSQFQSALDSACSRGNYAMVERLLSGAVGSFTPETIPDPLQVALSNRERKRSISILKGYGDINQKVGTYGNALQAAIAGGDQRLVKLLVQAGADLTARGLFGFPLRAAAVIGHFNIANYLLKEKVDVNAYDEKLGDALQAAAAKGYLDMVKLLLSYGADANGRGGYFGNSLQAACYHGCTEIVSVLLHNGADTMARGRYHDAYEAATYGGGTTFAELLAYNKDPRPMGGRTRVSKAKKRRLRLPSHY